MALEGHIIDSLVLPRVLDLILEAGAGYELLEVRIGRTPLDPSIARLRVDADDPVDLARLLEELRAHGANAVDEVDCEVRPAPADGVLPEGFYSSTNLPTEVRVGGRWRRVAPAEMDCAVVLTDPTPPRAPPPGPPPARWPTSWPASRSWSARPASGCRCRRSLGRTRRSRS